MKRLMGATAIGLLVAAGGMECIPIPNGDDNQPRVAALRGFDSEQELHDYLVDQVRTEQNRDDGGGIGIFPFFGGLPSPAADESFADSDDGAADSAGESVDFSTTNIQEAGVDESDIVKNDAETIFALQDRTIHVVDASPAGELAEVATIELDFYGDSLYFNGTTLIALSQNYGFYYEDDVVFEGDADAAQTSTDVLGGPYFDGAQTNIDFYDVTDPAAPTTIATVKLEGNLVSSRLIDTKLHVVTNSYPNFPFDLTPINLESTTVSEWIPDYQIETDAGMVADGDVVAWPDVFRPEDPNGYSITTVVTIDVTDPTAEFASTAITADAGVIYASTEALYLTDTDYSFTDFAAQTDTIVHKLSFTETGTEYIASGIVPGRPLNQYALGEYEDHLRIATTVDDFTSASSNNVYVMGVDGINLDVVGQVEGIAPGETIYAVRFLGPRGFVVTFKRIDPLFTLDLADPTDPQIIGELKVPGYSDHIQLLDENHLLTIGKDAQDAGDFAWVQGVQLSIFDVTDMAEPTLLHKEIIGGRGSSSEANSNPKAFNYYPPLNALAFPMDEYGSETSGPEFGGHVFTGLYVYRVTVENGFEELGRISSSDGLQEDDCFFGYYGFTRGVFIDDTVYAVRGDGVKAALVEDVSTIIGETTFANAEPPIEECFFVEPIDFLPVGDDVR